MAGVDSTDPNIALSVKPYQAPNILASAAAINQIKSQQLNQQLVQQEIQKQNAEQQQQQLALAGVKATNAAIAGSIDKATGQTDYQKAAQILEKTGYAQQGAALRDIATKSAEAHQTLLTSKLNYGAQQAKAIADTLGTVTDQNTYNAALGILGSRGIDTSKMSPIYNPDQVNDWVKTGLGHEQAIKDALTKAQTTEAGNKGLESASIADKNNAELPAIRAKSDAQQAAIEAFRADPNAAAANAIEGVLPKSLDAKANQSYSNSYRAAMMMGGPDAAQKVLDAATAHAAGLTKELNPAVRNAKISDDVAKGVAVENATAPIKERIAIDTARAMNGGGNPALQNTPPHLQLPAVQAAQKAGTEFTQATNAANEMQTMVDLMRKGNKVAYAYAPTTGVLTINSGNGIKRVNMAEIGQYAGAGSDFDKVKNFLEKHTTGEGVDDDIKKAMEGLHGSLYQNAKDDYRNKITNVNQNFSANFDSEPLIKGVKGPATATSAPIVQHSASTGAYRYSTDGEKTWQAGQPPK